MKKKTNKKIIENTSDFQSIMNTIKSDFSKEEQEYTKSDEEDIEELNCRVCGFEYEEDPPWQRVDGDWYANYEVCACCNVQFGYEDTSLSSVKAFRDKWVSDGANFHYKNLKPKNWSYEEQLKNVPEQWK